MKDNVNHPDHYKDGGVEVIDFIEAKNLGYHLGNVVKYVSRAGKKDPKKELEDLKKANWYLTRKIDNLGNTEYLKLHQLVDKIYNLYYNNNIILVPKIHVNNDLFEGFSYIICFFENDVRKLRQVRLTLISESYVIALQDALETSYEFIQLNDDYTKMKEGDLEVLQKYPLITNI